MSVYMTEEEQIEAIKKWWKKYSTLITIMVSILLLGIAGYRYWGWHQEKISTQASNTYEQMMMAVSNDDNKSMQAYANQLIKEYNDTVYADVARLTLAKHNIKNEKFAQAKDQLQKVAEKSHMQALQQLAKIRITRILIAEKSYDKALQELTEVVDETYLPVIYELKGDIYAATGRRSQAAVAYQKAVEEAQTQGVGNLFLEMKTSEFAGFSANSMSNSNVQTV